MRKFMGIVRSACGLVAVLLAVAGPAAGQVSGGSSDLAALWADSRVASPGGVIRARMSGLDLDSRFGPSSRLDSEVPRIELNESLQRQESETSLIRHLFVGAGLGVALGFATGWTFDSQQGSANSADRFWNDASEFYYRATGSIIGALVGGSVGGLFYLVRD